MRKKRNKSSSSRTEYQDTRAITVLAPDLA